MTKRRGFTIIELTFSITFMSILLLAILYVSIQAGKIYTKGLTYKNINQVSRELGDTIRRDFAPASANAISTVILPDGPGLEKTGRICNGRISYIWNTSAILSDKAVLQKAKYDNGQPVVFARVLDQGGALCTKDSVGGYPMVVQKANSTELLGADGRDLAVYQLKIDQMQSDGDKRGLYQLLIEFGTNEAGTTVYDADSNSYSCRPPSDTTANFDYCTVIDFEMILRTGGGI